MPYARLLAKSTRYPDQPEECETLGGHLASVADTMCELLQRRGESILQAHGLLRERWRADLEAASTRGALLHDLGKANGDFQEMVRGNRIVPQSLRHEAVGLVMLAEEPLLTDWCFAGVSDVVRLSVLRSMAGHHVKFDSFESLTPVANGNLHLDLLLGHSDFTEALTAAETRLGASGRPILKNRTVRLLDLPNSMNNFLREIVRWWHGTDDETRRFAAVVAALVVSADVCASIVSRSPARSTVVSRLNSGCSKAELQGAVSRRLDGEQPRPFQEAVAGATSTLALVIAGCGTGKTVAAWMWAGQKLAGRKLFFCYPTTGTASEGYFDYAWPEFEGKAALIHSRASLDIERFLVNGDSDPAEALIDGQLSYQGLRAWNAKATVCTADAVLGLMQNNRLGLFSYPAIVGAGFVFDEVHLYDERMFGTLLRFLDAFRGAPVLLMTATLQPARRRALEQVAEVRGTELEVFFGPRELEEMPRYEVCQASRSAAMTAALEASRRGDRVLWVANTVPGAISDARALSGAGAIVQPYHSRYRYCDRLTRHAAVMGLAGRKSVPGGGIAITTQVCEVSLDISADLLVTELAPPASLIQRMGRLNRWAVPGDGRPPKPALVVEPERIHHPFYPYDAADVDLGRRWLATATRGPTSQADLAGSFEALLQNQSPPARVRSTWLDEVTRLVREPVREDGVTANFIREEDLDGCRDRRGFADQTKLQSLMIPMVASPVMKELADWRSFGPAIVAPAGRIDYDDFWGGTWAK